MVVLGAAQRRPDQPAIRESLLITTTLYRDGIGCIFHGDTAYDAGERITTIPGLHDRGYKGVNFGINRNTAHVEMTITH